MGVKARGCHLERQGKTGLRMDEDYIWIINVAFIKGELSAEGTVS